MVSEVDQATAERLHYIWGGSQRGNSTENIIDSPSIHSHSATENIDAYWKAALPGRATSRCLPQTDLPWCMQRCRSCARLLGPITWWMRSTVKLHLRCSNFNLLFQLQNAGGQTELRFGSHTNISVQSHTITPGDYELGEVAERKISDTLNQWRLQALHTFDVESL